MPVNFTVDTAARLVRATVTGPAKETPDEFRAFLDALVACPDFRPGFDILYDRRAAGYPPDDAFVRAAEGAIEARADRLGGCRWAVVIGTQPALEVVRMAALLGERAAVEARPFFAPDDALGWFGHGGVAAR